MSLYAQERPKAEEKDAAKGAAIVGNGVLMLWQKKRVGSFDALFLPSLKFTFELFLAFLFLFSGG